MNKKIIITECEDEITLFADKGIKWSTFITGIEMMIESILEKSEISCNIDDVLNDIKRIYERDKKEEKDD